VLVLLRRDYIAEATWMDLSCLDDDPQAGCSPVDAAVLACGACARLAAVLTAWLADACRLDGWTPGRDAAPRGGVSFAYPAFILRVGPPQGLYDTS
jgi:hypothetical protein